MQKSLAAAEREQQDAVGTSQSCQQSLAGERLAAVADWPVMYIAARLVLSDCMCPAGAAAAGKISTLEHHQHFH